MSGTATTSSGQRRQRRFDCSTEHRGQTTMNTHTPSTPETTGHCFIYREAGSFTQDHLAQPPLSHSHLRVVLQDLPVDELPDLLNGQLPPLKLKRQLADRPGRTTAAACGDEAFEELLGCCSNRQDPCHNHLLKLSGEESGGSSEAVDRLRPNGTIRTLLMYNSSSSLAADKHTHSHTRMQTHRASPTCAEGSLAGLCRLWKYGSARASSADGLSAGSKASSRRSSARAPLTAAARAAQTADRTTQASGVNKQTQQCLLGAAVDIGRNPCGRPEGQELLSAAVCTADKLLATGLLALSLLETPALLLSSLLPLLLLLLLPLPPDPRTALLVLPTCQRVGEASQVNARLLAHVGQEPSGLFVAHLAVRSSHNIIIIHQQQHHKERRSSSQQRHDMAIKIISSLATLLRPYLTTQPAPSILILLAYKIQRKKTEQL